MKAIIFTFFLCSFLLISCKSKEEKIKDYFSQATSLVADKRYEEALDIFDKIIELDSKYFEAWYNKGETYYYIYDFDNAVKCFNKAIEIKPDLDYVNIAKGVAFDKAGKNEESLEAFNAAIQKNNLKDTSWNYRGVALYKLKRFDEAIQSYAKALALKTDNAQTWYNLSCAYALQDNKVDMLSSLKTAIKFHKSYADKAKSDPDFKSFKNDDDFLQLINSKNIK